MVIILVEVKAERYIIHPNEKMIFDKENHQNP